MFIGVSRVLDNQTITEFTRYMKKYPDLYNHLANIIGSYVTLQQPVIVDLGVGPGLLAQQLVNQYPVGKLVGIDPQKEMLRTAQQTVSSPSFHPLQGSAETLPLKTASVDAVVSRCTLPYWSHLIQGFTEVFRVVKPGGIFVVEDLNRTYPAWKRFFVKLHMALNRAGSVTIRYHFDAYTNAYARDQVEQSLKTSGFTILRSEGEKSEWKFLLVAQKPL